MEPATLDRDQLWTVLERIPAFVWMSDAADRCVYLNFHAREFCGDRAGRDIGRFLEDLVHEEDYGPARIAFEQHIEEKTRVEVELRVRRHDGEWRWMQVLVEPCFGPDGAWLGAIGVNFDVTQAKQRDGELVRLATHNKLTGLPNRVLIESLIETAIDKARRAGRKLPILTFGVDRFQSINEMLGHGAGDQLLTEIGRRLVVKRHGSEIAGHLSGNRFVLIGESGTGSETAYRAAGRLIDLCRAPFSFGEMTHELSGSVGIALYPDDAQQAGELMRAGEAALQTAKLMGGNQFAFFDRVEHGQARDKLALEIELRRAIPRGELVLHFQPKVALPDYRLVGFEALVRWQHPERGLLPPVLFIGLAEEAGLIKPLTRWVFDEVGRQLQAWIAAGLEPIPIAINVSPREFLTALMDDHLPAYQAHLLPGGLLEIEITESTMIEDFERVRSTVELLHGIGIDVGMDDFGTGYSSLAGLNQLPISSLKIDRAFTKDVDWNRASRAVASAIISMARELGLDVIAEGVETQEQLRVLRSLDCTVVQGYLTGRPASADEAADLLRGASEAANIRLAQAETLLHPTSP
jgi:diguanylate cyclase (GGDEF)-like protein/PAS domain S-box-containing protein